MRARHEIWKEKYPDTKQAHGFPFTGIENARPETIKASKPRFNKDALPFDVEGVMKKSKDYEDFEANWGFNKSKSWIKNNRLQRRSKSGVSSYCPTLC